MAVLAYHEAAPPSATGQHSGSGTPTAALQGRRNRIVNMFGRIKDCRRVETRDDRRARAILSPHVLAAAVRSSGGPAGQRARAQDWVQALRWRSSGA